MAGTSLKTCVQAFFRLKKAGLIITCHGTITIQNGVCLKDRMDAL
jgi:hypothetical protein